MRRDPLTQVFDGEVRGARRELSVGRRADVHASPRTTAATGCAKARRCAGSRFRLPYPGNLPLPDIATASIVDAREPDAADLRSGRRGAVDHPRRRRHGRCGHRSGLGAEGHPQAGERERLRLSRAHRSRKRLGHVGRARRPGRRASAALHVVARPPAGRFHARVRPLADRLLAARLEGRADRQRSAVSCGCRRSR